MTLHDVGMKHNTDKAWAHGYTPVYERNLQEFQDRPATFLEIGFGGHADENLGGESARMWREFYPQWTIIVTDIVNKTTQIEGVNFRQGSQDDPDFALSLVDEFGMFDVIVDDASHIITTTIETLKLYWPLVSPGGLYFIEDISTSYVGGINDGTPDPRDHTIENSSVAFAANLAHDVMNNVGWVRDLFTPTLGDVVELAFSPNLVMLRKGGSR